MGGRGRGRGRGAPLPINLESFGLARADVLTPIQSQPPPLYPPLQFKPVPLSSNDELEYRLALKQELRDLFRKSPFYVNPPKKVKDIERYSDKYQVGVGDAQPKLQPDWNRLPAELQEKRKRKSASKSYKPNLKAKRAKDNMDNLFQKIENNAPAADEEAEDNEEEEGEEKKKDKKDDDEEGDEVEIEDEELEEETDYNMAYFDNGEGYGDDDDDDDEGPTY